MQKNFLLYLMLIVTFSISCKKIDSGIQSRDQQLINESRQYFESSVLTQAILPSNFSDTRKNPFGNIHKAPVWDAARKVLLSNANAVLVPVHFKTPFPVNSNFSAQKAYNSDDITRLLVYKDQQNIFHAELLTFFPDSSYAADGTGKFIGIIVTADWAGNLLNRFKVDAAGRVQKYCWTNCQHVAAKSSVRDANSNLQIIQVCYQSSGYNYSSDYPGGYYWTQDLGCETYYIPDNGGGGTGPATGSYYASLGTNDVGGFGPINPPTLVTLIKGDNIIPNISEYNKCFTNTPGYDHSFKIMLCVEQPEPGTRDTWGLSGAGSLGSGNPVSVGHTFLILSETSSTGIFTRNVGFYPASSVNPASPIDQGQLNNDVYHDFDIAVNITLNNSQFFQVLNFIEQGNNTGYMYNLNTNNCTTFALNALASAGINMPRTIGSWTLGSGLNPGDLGEDLRNMQLPSNMSKTTVSGTHPNAGFCY